MTEIKITFRPAVEVAYTLHYFLEGHFNNMFSMVPISMKAGPLETVVTYNIDEKLRPEIKEALVDFFSVFKTDKFKVEEKVENNASIDP